MKTRSWGWYLGLVIRWQTDEFWTYPNFTMLLVHWIAKTNCARNNTSKRQAWLIHVIRTVLLAVSRKDIVYKIIQGTLNQNRNLIIVSRGDLMRQLWLKSLTYWNEKQQFKETYSHLLALLLRLQHCYHLGFLNK